MPLLHCENNCGGSAIKPKDVKSYRCGSCNQVAMAQIDARKRKQAEIFSPEECKRLRKSEGFTQQELSFHLNLAKTIIGRFERGSIEIPPPELIEWMETRM